MNCNNSGGGSLKVDPVRDLKVYDQLHPSVRDFLKTCLIDYGLTRNTLKWITEAGPTGALLALVDDDQRQRAKGEKQRVKAIGPWKGNVPLVAESRRT